MIEKEMHKNMISDFEINKVTIVNSKDSEAEKRAYTRGIFLSKPGP